MQQLPFANFDALSTPPYSSSKRNPTANTNTGSPKQQQQQQGGGARANMVVQLLQEEQATVEICVASLNRYGAVRACPLRSLHTRCWTSPVHPQHVHT